jgi:protein ImuB
VKNQLQNIFYTEKQDDMGKRYVVICFRHLKTDWHTRRKRELKGKSFALSVPDHGRMVIESCNEIAESKGIFLGMAVADARAIDPSIIVIDDQPDHSSKILKALAEWCIRYTPSVSICLPHALILDSTGCAHLWTNEDQYISDIHTRLTGFGYHVGIGMSDSIGSAWAVSCTTSAFTIVPSGDEQRLLSPLPVATLRLATEISNRLNTLGLRNIGDLLHIERTALRRRFGEEILLRLDQAFGIRDEFIETVSKKEPYEIRLPCLEPITTRAGIDIALETVLNALCSRLRSEGKGLRHVVFKCFRTDGKLEQVEVGTNRATNDEKHLTRLFEIKIDQIEPGLGIDFFIAIAMKVEPVSPIQKKIWDKDGCIDNKVVAELLDRFDGKLGPNHIYRYLPDEHYWPERSFKAAQALNETPTIPWKPNTQRPVQILKAPEKIEVTAPVPDYPPMMFSYRGKRHKVMKADGPERIEQEWWLQQGEHRDYYCVEDEDGHRYWLFRHGHYDSEKFEGWFIHGFFA